MTTQTEIPDQIDAKLSDLREIMSTILARLDAPKENRHGFTVEEVASILGKRPYTVREWCRGGRIEASKRTEKRGGAELWNITVR